MTTTFRAHFDGSVLVPEEPVDLPLGEVLQFEVAGASAQRPPPDITEDGPLLRLLRALEDIPANLDAPNDAAANLDHYLYGVAKKE
ncbi:MAG TPA: hypothetical protein VFJ58_28180 [Armatimonadota bacterium]|nr:hypothetical protein [Armatimonadota bacterium]